MVAAPQEKNESQIKNHCEMCQFVNFDVTESNRVWNVYTRERASNVNHKQWAAGDSHQRRPDPGQRPASEAATRTSRHQGSRQVGGRPRSGTRGVHGGSLDSRTSTGGNWIHRRSGS